MGLVYLIYLSIALISILIYLFIESFIHNQNLKKIPIRIHVNGTRGKSSVTRLIAAALRAGNIKTVAKTTGTLARLIDADGKEESVYRIGYTNIIEQVRVIAWARKKQAQALVIKCMGHYTHYYNQYLSLK